MREIRIREMRFDAARLKLEVELNEAFMAGETRVSVLHGIGSGKLRKLTETVVNDMGFGRLVTDTLDSNPGTTLVDLFPPDSHHLKMMKGRS